MTSWTNYIHERWKGAIENSPIVHELDTTDLNKWTENIFEKSSKIFKDYLERYEQNCDSNLNERKEPCKFVHLGAEIHEYNKCEICDKVFVNKSQWNCKF